MIAPRALLAAALLALLAAAPSAASTTREPNAPVPAGILAVPHPSAPRDVVIDSPGKAGAGAGESASASANRYPVHDGRGRTVAISVSGQCRSVCTGANPQQIANFLGTLIHGNEMSLLNVRMVAPSEMTNICGGGVLACYFSGENRMVISGNDNQANPPNPSREFVIAHEYGHHISSHRLNPPFRPTIDWGTKRWASYERICQGTRAGRYFPGSEGSEYASNPGEAFAESYAFVKFPHQIGWNLYTPSLRPDRGALQAIREDTLHPWRGRTRIVVRGELSALGPSSRVERIRTPLDGTVSLRLVGPGRAAFDLILRDRSGRVLRRAAGPGAGRSINYTICGQASVTAVVRRAVAGSGGFGLVVRKP